LILDEPTTGLDPNQIVEIREVIKQQGKNKTVLFSTHILQEVQAICDRVIIINKGEIVADDKLSHLLKKNVYSNSVILQIKEQVNENIFGGIQNKQRLDNNTWQFTTDDPDRLKKILLEICLSNNLNILSLQTESQNLEEIFRRLTVTSSDQG